MRVAAIQLEVSDAESTAVRRDRATALVRAQHGADLVVLPELWPTGAFAQDLWAASAEPLDGPTVAALAAAARSLGAVVHGGSFVEQGEDGLHNTSVVLGPDGSLLAVYRKVHLFGFAGGEREVMADGDPSALVVLDVAGARVGLSTCYDLRFPELYRSLVDLGAEVLVCVAGWPAVRSAHWSVLTRARAVEDQAVVVAVGTAGTHAGVEMAGRSAVVDATGEVLAEAGTGPEVLTVDLDLDEARAWRRRFPALGDRRMG